MRNYFTILVIFLITNGFSQTDITALGGQVVNTCGDLQVTSIGGANTYADNIDITFTICPDTIGSGDNLDYISLDFSSFNLDVSDDGVNLNDRLIIFDGPNNTYPILGTYLGTDLSSQSVISASGTNPTGCLTIQFVSNTVNDAAQVWGFSYFASCAVPCSSPVAMGEIVNGITNDSIMICPNQSIDFLENGSFAQVGYNLAQFTWDFDDGTTLPGGLNGAVAHSYSDPGYYQVKLIVQDDNPDNVCVNSLLLILQVLVATPPTFFEFPQDTTLCIGESIDLDAQVEFYDSTYTDYPEPVEVPFPCLDDSQGITQSNDIFQNEFILGSTITSIGDIQSICLEMEHSYIGDLVIEVICPNGQSVVLHNQGGGGTFLGEPIDDDNTPVSCDPDINMGVFYTYCFEPFATTTWVEWSAVNNGTLPAGAYESINDLSGLIGCPTNGNWQLEITDNFASDDGFVDFVYINLNPALYQNIVQFTPQIGDDSDSSSWDINDPFVTNLTADGNIATITPTVAGNYQYNYSVIDDFGCTNDSVINITVDPQVFVSASLDSIVCSSDVVVIGPEIAQCVNDGGNYTYCYDNNENTVFTYCPDNPGDGLTFMQISFNAGSTESGWDDITVYDGPDANSPLIGVFEGDLSGMVFTATNAGGCITMVLSSDGSISCASGSETMWDFDVQCGGAGGITYVWTPNDGSLDNVNIMNPAVINLVSPTTYTLTVFPTGHPQCMTSDDVIVAENPDSGIDSSVIFCFEGGIENLFNYLGGSPVAGGIWFNPIGQQITMPIEPDTLIEGTYKYEVTNGFCTDSAFITVTINQLGLSAIIDHSDCNAFNGEIQLTAANTMGPFQFSNDGGVIFQAGDTFTGGMGSGNLYSFMVQDSVGCIATIDSIVIDNSFPVIDINSIVLTDSDCSLDNGGVVSVTTNGGTANYTYSIDGVVYQTLSLSNLMPNTYDLIVQDNFGCTDTTEIVINEINAPLITDVIPTNISCYTLNDGVIEIIGDNLQSFSIDNGVSFQNSNTFNGLIAGTYDIVAASGPNGTLCTFVWMDQIVITEPTALQIDTISSGMIVCVGDEITLGVLGSGGNGNYTYDWGNFGEGSPISIVVDASMQVCVTMSEDCPSPTVTPQCVDIITSPSIFLKLETVDRDGCYPLESVFINITNDPTVASSTWSFSDNGSETTVSGSGNVDYTFQNPGVFDVSLSVVSIDGCEYDTTYSQYITVHNHPNANYSYTPIPMTVYDTEAQFVDYSTGEPIIWEWHFGTGAIPLTSSEENPTVQYPQGIAAVYPTSLHVYNELGCVDSMLVQVEVINDVLIFAPNVFTPDGDSYNETWRVFISGVDVYDFHCTIFNRWGEIVWESYNVDGEWDGTYAGGNQVQDGTYVWVVYANDSYDDKKYEFRGTVNILR